MSKLNGKELAYGVLHGTVHTPQSGQIGPVLSATPGPITKAVKMTVDEPFVTVEVPNKTGKATVINVPIVNFSHMVVKEDLATNNKA